MNLPFETAAAVGDTSRTWSIVLTAVGSTLSVVFGLLVLAVNNMSTRFEKKMESLGNRIDEKIEKVREQVKTIGDELTSITRDVYGNDKVEGDHGIAGRVNGHAADLAKLSDRVTDLERPRVRR